MVCNFKTAHSKFILGKTSSYKMHGSRDAEDLEREGELRENENASLHENPRVLTSCNDTGRRKFPINKSLRVRKFPRRHIPTGGRCRHARCRRIMNTKDRFLYGKGETVRSQRGPRKEHISTLPFLPKKYTWEKNQSKSKETSKSVDKAPKIEPPKIEDI